MTWSASCRTRALMVAAVMALAGSVAGCSSEMEAGHPSPRAAPDHLSGCFKLGHVDSIAGLNAFVGRLRGDPSFTGGDVGASVDLQDRRQLFVFGDTLRGAGFPGEEFVRNSMLVFTRRCGRAVLPADGGAVIPDRRDGVGYWPMSIARVHRPGYDLVGIGCQRVRSTGEGGVFGFEVLGPSYATFVIPTGGTPEFVSITDIGPDVVDTRRPMWGAAAVVNQGWVYAYGTARPRDAGIRGFSLRVARMRPDSITSPSTWQYWTGSAWSRRPGDAKVLIPSEGGVSQTLSVFQQDGHWYAVSKKDEVLGTDLTIWTAPAPTGPFTAAATAAKIPSDAATGTLRYMPLAHPDLLPEPGTVVVSYSQNNSDFSLVQQDPRRYRPHFLRIKLPR